MDNYTIPDETYLGGSGKFSLLNHTTGNGSNLGDLEGLAYLCSCCNLLFLLRCKHTLYTALYLVYCVVDYRVEPYLNALPLRYLARAHRWTYLESYNNGIGCRRKQNIGL